MDLKKVEKQLCYTTFSQRFLYDASKEFQTPLIFIIIQVSIHDIEVGQ